MKKILVIIDMQKDFVDGALGSAEAIKIVPRVAELIRDFDGDELFVTYDTHGANYADSLEGKKLPVAHCIEGTDGHALTPTVAAALADKPHTDVLKYTFGTFELADILKKKYPHEEFTVTCVGLCTDICVISNVLILRAAFPNAVITVDASACAGVTVEKHKAALEAMKSCQIDVVGEKE